MRPAACTPPYGADRPDWHTRTALPPNDGLRPAMAPRAVSSPASSAPGAPTMVGFDKVLLCILMFGWLAFTIVGGYRNSRNSSQKADSRDRREDASASRAPLLQARKAKRQRKPRPPAPPPVSPPPDSPPPAPHSGAGALLRPRRPVHTKAMAGVPRRPGFAAYGYVPAPQLGDRRNGRDSDYLDPPPPAPHSGGAAMPRPQHAGDRQRKRQGARSPATPRPASHRTRR